MQSLYVSEERQYCPWKSVALQITKISNPIQGMNFSEFRYKNCTPPKGFSNDSHQSPSLSVHPTILTPPSTERGKKGKTRSKRTLPKPDQPDKSEAFSSFHTPPDSPDDCLNIDRQHHDRSEMMSDGDEDLEDEEMQDYRRFSSRTKRKTKFFGVEHSIAGCRRNGGGALRNRGKRRKRSLTSPGGAKRTLQFSEQLLIEPIKTPPAKIEGDSLNNIKAPVVKEAVVKDTGVNNAPLPTLAAAKEHDDKDVSLNKKTEKDSPGDCDNESKMVSTSEREMVEKKYPIGTMVWGKLPGYDWWPGILLSYSDGTNGIKKEVEELSDDETDSCSVMRVWVKWYGDNQLSQIPVTRLAPFELFAENYHPLQMKGVYKRAVIAAIKDAAKRCKMEFLSRSDDKKLRWTITENCPQPHLIDTEKQLDQDEEVKVDAGVKGGIGVKVDEKVKDEGRQLLSPPPHNKEAESAGNEITNSSPMEIEKQQSSNKSLNKSNNWRSRRGRGKGDRGAILLTSLEQEMLLWALGGFQPAGPDGLKPSSEHQIQVHVIPVEKGGAGGRGTTMDGTRSGDSNDGEEPPRKRAKVMLLQVMRKARFDSVLEGRVKIADLCIGCGELEVHAEHPLFDGGLCKECKDMFMECAYLFDDDGTQMYCTICSGGEEVFMCDAENCAKVYCAPCIEKLCGLPELERVKAADKWLCYMCCPEHTKVGLLTKREDWVYKLKELFMNDHEMEYDPPPFYPPIPPDERRPIRVLGLFDGIATGLLVLKELGIQVECYVASEIDQDAVYVSRVQHNEIIHVGTIERITEKEVKAWGPFDLIIGGSPCNDLSIVNPARKGIYEGTGRLFFEFFRILSYAKPNPNEDRPFFWLYENVVSMRAHDKQTISRFLQCNPVVVDAREMSAAHRARYFWGNLPGMNRPTYPLPGDRLTLQDCLEPNCFRLANFTKLRTITTKMNSIKQTKKAIYPVRFEGTQEGNEQEQGDVLWCTEMERLFGFPDHYTDVANLGRSGRQRLLGKAWSVPVIRHLLSPLKDYFKSSTTMEPNKVQQTPPTKSQASPTGDKL